MTRKAANLTTGLLVLAAACAVLAAARVRLSPPAPQARVLEPRIVQPATGLVDGRNVMGATNASLTIVVFSDFRCPFCALLSDSLANMLAMYPGRLAFAFRHFPLDSVSRAVAIASECAAEIGRFEEFHWVAFEHQAQIQQGGWQSVPALANLARGNDRMLDCLTAPDAASRVQGDIEMATALGIRATPSMVIDSILYTGVHAATIVRAQMKERWQ